MEYGGGPSSYCHYSNRHSNRHDHWHPTYPNLNSHCYPYRDFANLYFNLYRYGYLNPYDYGHPANGYLHGHRNLHGDSHPSRGRDGYQWWNCEHLFSGVSD